ncbi:hypothetical protein [Mastigocladopsis repens]|uniref:hypothetical protein n=1 Tax=Mastigocladopsis repens TaxID=221287 RepID=UPI001E3B55E0|nr:hypothetical protein [Mastigocladopsis repens]
MPSAIAHHLNNLPSMLIEHSYSAIQLDEVQIAYGTAYAYICVHLCPSVVLYFFLYLTQLQTAVVCSRASTQVNLSQPSLTASTVPKFSGKLST